MKKIMLYFLPFLLSGIMLESCIKKDDFKFKNLAAFSYQPNVVAPLIHSHLTLWDVIADYDSSHIFVQNGTHFIYLEYYSTVFSQTANQLFSLSDQNINSNWSFSTGTINPPDSAMFSYSSNYTFTTMGTERLDTVILKTGNLNYAINGNINHNARIYITIPGATKNGLPFQKTIYYSYTGSLPVLINNSFNLDGYTVIFAAGNQITINYDVEVYGDANSNNSPYNINMGEALQSLQFNKMFGYLGQQTFALNQDSVYLQLFHNNIHGTMFFEAPRLYVKVNNAYGMPINLNFAQLEAISLVNPPYNASITGTGLPNPWLISAPSYAQLGQSVQSLATLTDSNSNIQTLINMAPKYVSYHLSGISNPNGNPLTDHNFVIDTSRFSVKVQVELPMYGRAWDFELEDTVAFTLGSQVNDIDWIKFKINTVNDFPVDASLQAYFVDSTYSKLDSLLVPMQQVIQSGIVGPAPDYIVISPTYKYTETTIDKSRLIHLENVKKILIYAKLATVNNGADIVKFYSYYNLDVKIGAQAQINYLVNPH